MDCFFVFFLTFGQRQASHFPPVASNCAKLTTSTVASYIEVSFQSGIDLLI